MDWQRTDGLEQLLVGKWLCELKDTESGHLHTWPKMCQYDLCPFAEITHLMEQAGFTEGGKNKKRQECYSYYFCFYSPWVSGEEIQTD